jgi:hypothetical protein
MFRNWQEVEAQINILSLGLTRLLSSAEGYDCRLNIFFKIKGSLMNVAAQSYSGFRIRIRSFSKRQHSLSKEWLLICRANPVSAKFLFREKMGSSIRFIAA